jgi:hypothetical protein
MDYSCDQKRLEALGLAFDRTGNNNNVEVFRDFCCSPFPALAGEDLLW